MGTSSLVALAALLLPCCSSPDPEVTDAPASPEDVAAPPVDEGPPADAGVNLAGSYYSLQIVMPSGLLQKYERQIDEKTAWIIAFGSSHIAPAVSLAIEDQYQKPYAVVTFNFGFVVGSNDHPVTITEEGKWEWGKGGVNAPPAFKVTAKDEHIQRTLVSWHEKSDGHYFITKWGKVEGEVVEGKIEGTLVNENDPDTANPATGTVSGKFRLVLPAPGH